MIPVQDVVESTVTGLGYELVDLEFASRGLLRIYIDKPAEAGADPVALRIRIEDCEIVTRQLQRVFEVENIDYDRLEVSSPGLDRPLVKPADFVRFAGLEVSLRLKVPVGNRRNFEGVLRAQGESGESDEPRFGLEFESKDGTSLLSFTFDEVEKARLVPKVSFKGS